MDCKIDLKSPEGRKEFIAVMAEYGKKFIEKDGKVYREYEDGSLYPTPMNETPAKQTPEELDKWENDAPDDSLEKYEAYYAEHKEEMDDREFAFFVSRGVKPEDLPAKEDHGAYQKWLDAKQPVI